MKYLNIYMYKYKIDRVDFLMSKWTGLDSLIPKWTGLDWTGLSNSYVDWTGLDSSWTPFAFLAEVRWSPVESTGVHRSPSGKGGGEKSTGEPSRTRRTRPQCRVLRVRVVESSAWTREGRVFGLWGTCWVRCGRLRVVRQCVFGGGEQIEAGEKGG